MLVSDGPTIDVVICCYNSEKYLNEAIDSVIGQTYKNWHLIIINDGSWDSTEHIIRSYIRSGVPITYHDQENEGFASARQRALELSQNDWIAILDHDDLWYPNKLGIQAETIKEHPNLGVLFSNSELFSEDDDVIRLNLEPNKFRTGIMENAFHKLFLHGCYIDSITAVLNRDALMDLGGFNTLYTYVADYDVFIGMAYKYNVYFDNQILSKWRIHSDQSTQTMKSQIVEEHVNLFESVLEGFDLDKKTKTEVKRQLFKWLRNQGSIDLENGNFSKFFKTVPRLVECASIKPMNYLRIIRTIMDGFSGRRTARV